MTLDNDDKVYCTADTTYARTRIRGGLGHPEIVCDARHCQIIVPYIGAAMKKVKKYHQTGTRSHVVVCVHFHSMKHLCNNCHASTTPSWTLAQGLSQSALTFDPMMLFSLCYALRFLLLVYLFTVYSKFTDCLVWRPLQMLLLQESHYLNCW